MKLRTPRHNLTDWARFIKQIRHFFDSRGFTEVFTPSLVTAGAFEHALDSLRVSFTGGSAELHTSPEMEMKRLLSGGSGDIYQITKCYRDDPETGIHFQEFHMLEFYQVGKTYQQTLQLTQELMNELAGHSLPFQTLTVEAAWQEFASESLVVVEMLSDASIQEDRFFDTMLNRVEPHLPADKPVFLFDYPQSTSTLAKTGAGGRGERFECYWQGMELCNGATELGDAEELKRRYELESSLRRKAGKEPHPFPQTLYDALLSLPDCSGVAVGLDRLFLCLERNKTP